MDIVGSLRAFIYCAGFSPDTRTVFPSIDGNGNDRWSNLQALLEASRIPVILVTTKETLQRKNQNEAKFDFTASAHSKEQLHALLSKPAVGNPTSVLVGGYYAETLVTDVSFAALRHGYDTFVIWDRVWAISEAGLEAAKARLLQAGAVPTSFDQVLHRWG